MRKNHNNTLSVLFAFEHKKAYISYKDEIDELKKSNPVSLLFLPRPVYDIQTLSDHLKNYKLDKGIQFVDPVRTISWSNNLCNIYYNIYRAPNYHRFNWFFCVNTTTLRRCAVVTDSPLLKSDLDLFDERNMIMNTALMRVNDSIRLL